MDATTLLAHHANGSRRTSVLTTDDDSVSVRAKVFEDDEHALLQIRAWIDPMNHYLHAYFDIGTGALLVSTTGTQDQDAYERAANELQRRGITLS
jgi:hypothetical protein